MARYEHVELQDMITADDFRKKAAEWLGKAEAASDPNTSASMRRASDAWAALAQQSERAALPLPRSAGPLKRPADLAKPRDSHIDSVQIANVLRDRLHLNGDRLEESSE
jgi:hypothetical protein